MKKITFMFTFLLCISFFAGCERTTEESSVADLVPTGNISTQTCPTRVTKEQLVDGTFYVYHNGFYYELWNTYTSYDVGNTPESADETRMSFFTTEDEIYVPTLFVQNGDKLIYYSESTLVDYIVWERLMDLGYTIGAYNINTMTSGRCWLDLSGDDETIIPGTELYNLYELKVDNVLLDKIGNVQLKENYLKLGIIHNLEKSQKYNLDVYTGTQYKHYVVAANIHAFSAMEVFASIEYDTKQATIYDITLPEYFINGYYNVMDKGVVRIVYDEYYNEETDFNKPLLLVEDGKAKAMYSTFEPLNKFQTNIAESLGYTGEKPEKSKSETVYEEFLDKIQAATIGEYDLFFPAGEECVIRITSTENTGDCSVRIGNKTYALTRTGNTYSVTIEGDGSIGTLTVSGFVNPITMDFVGCVGN